jgi:predicted alpha/beta hydrolase
VSMNHSNDVTEVRESAVEIHGSGTTLKGRLIEPLEGSTVGTLLINNATGVPARFYAPFARWVAASQRRAVLIWDYRDFGESGQPRGSRATMADWGIDDATTVRAWLKARYSELPLWLVGHSLGGLTLPFQAELDKIARVITVASGPVHLSDHPWLHRVAVGSVWYGHGALLTAVLGHFPGRRLGLGADLPGPVFWQWRRWCSQRGSVRVDPTIPPLSSQDLRAPVTLFAFSDDALVPPPAVWRLADWMPAAEITRRLIEPREHGLKRIGHVAAFSPRSRVLWPELMKEDSTAVGQTTSRSSVSG